MTQSTYVSACDCQKPLPLIKTNYLSEFRTEIEKAKARENLGITDGQVLEWGKITGHIEDNEDLHKYIKKQQEYTYQSIDKDMPTMENITTIQEGIEYVLRYIDLMEQSGLTVTQIKQDCENLKTQIAELTNGQVATNTENIETINGQIQEINRAIQEINANANNLEWIKLALQNSRTIVLDESNILEVKLSEEENNALSIEEDGLYTKDHSEEIKNIKDSQKNMKDTLDSLKDSVNYASDLPDTTESPVLEGVTVGDLKNKSLTEIIDAAFFPATSPELIYPSLSLTGIPEIMPIGSAVPQPIVVFQQGNAGDIEETSTEITLNGNLFEGETFNEAGTYTYTVTIKYGQGDFILNNRGEETGKRVDGGTLVRTITTKVAYPWYTGQVGSLYAQETYVPFGQISEELKFSTSKFAQIRIPGAHAQLISFKLNSGLGIQDVNMADWEETVVDVNGVPYKQYTKKSAYAAVIQHIIKFKPVQ